MTYVLIRNGISAKMAGNLGFIIQKAECMVLVSLLGIYMF